MQHAYVCGHSCPRIARPYWPMYHTAEVYAECVGCVCRLCHLFALGMDCVVQHLFKAFVHAMSENLHTLCQYIIAGTDLHGEYIRKVQQMAMHTINIVTGLPCYG